MSVLVGIPTHRRPELLRQCLDSVAAQAGDLPPVRVFVADNDARGQEGARLVEELAAAYRFPISGTIVAEPGISAVRNAILEEARRGGDDFIAMIDDDMRVEAQWLSKMLKRIRGSNAGAVGCSVIHEFHTVVPDRLRRTFSYIPKPGGQVDSLIGTGGILISKSALDHARWPAFDPRLGLSGGEDADWFAGLAKYRTVFAWAPDALAFEFVPAERARLGWLLRRQFRVGITEINVARKYGQYGKAAKLLVKAGAAVVLAPFLALDLLIPTRRYGVLARWTRSVGRIGSLFGADYHEYARRHHGERQAD